jgi:hypothetical protein
VKSGITRVTSSLLAILAAVQGGTIASRPDIPSGFTASLYARGIPGARNLAVLPDGTLTLHGRVSRDRFEIVPPTDDAPVTVLRVAMELDAPRSRSDGTRAVQAPDFVQMRWNAASGEIAYLLAPQIGRGIPVAPQTLALARSLSLHEHSDVALAPDGTLFVADSRAGAVWKIRRNSL